MVVVLVLVVVVPLSSRRRSCVVVDHVVGGTLAPGPDVGALRVLVWVCVQHDHEETRHDLLWVVSR